LSYLGHTQTNRETNKIRQKHNLLGGGNKSATNSIHCFLSSATSLSHRCIYKTLIHNLEQTDWLKMTDTEMTNH